MLTAIEKVLLLQDIRFLEYAYTEHMAQLASICHESEVSRGTVLFREGEESSHFHLLLNGRVVLEKDGVTLNSVKQGGLDFWSFFSESPHQLTATAEEKCRLFTVSFEDMLDLLTAEPEFCWAILRKLAQLGKEFREDKHDKAPKTL
jgi:CRP-like cAMP-binding protein